MTNQVDLVSQLFKRQHIEQLRQQKAMDSVPQVVPASNFLAQKILNQTLGFNTSEKVVLNPSVEMRQLELDMVWEEFKEYVVAMGFYFTIKYGEPVDGGEDLTAEIILKFDPELTYDPVETGDGITDIKVLLNGTAAKLGLPQPDFDHEVFCSNMSKVDRVTGRPVVNQCADEECGRDARIEGRDHVCYELSHMPRPDQPIGKRLKPSTYVPANIARVLYEYAVEHGVTEL